MEGLPPLLESDYHDLSLTNGAQGLWSFSEILAARLPELKEAFLSRSAYPGSNLGSSLGLGSRDPLVNNADTSMPTIQEEPQRPLFSEKMGQSLHFRKMRFCLCPATGSLVHIPTFSWRRIPTAAPYPITCSTRGLKMTRFILHKRRLRPAQGMRV